jgi:hypothetical protein
MDKYFNLILTRNSGEGAVISATMLADDGETAKASFNIIPSTFWERLRVPLHTAVGAVLSQDFSPLIMEVHTTLENADPASLTRRTVLILTHPDNGCPFNIDGYLSEGGTSGGEEEFIAAAQIGAGGIDTTCPDCQVGVNVVGAYTRLEI